MLFAGLIAGLASVAAAQLVLVPQTPSTDPFYQPPAGFANSAPGTVLKSRGVISAFAGLLPEPIQTYQLLYRTTAINGTPIATVTTIFKPLVGNLTQDKFVSFQTAEDSSWINCAPSYNYQLLAQQTDAIVTFESLLIQTYLGKGYIVVSPDYEGPDASFGGARLAGMGVLDSMRAVNNFAATLGLKTDGSNSIVGLGYSGGAIATGWAASLHSSYASELNVAGWAAGGTPANLTGTALYVDNTTDSGFLPAAIDGMNKPSTYAAQIGPVIASIVTPKGQAHLDYANSHCATDDLSDFSNQSILSYDFQSLGPRLFDQPAIHAVMQRGIMGITEGETPVAPVLLYHSLDDEIIPYSNASTLYNNWCEQGASVQFVTFQSGGHAGTEINGLSLAQNFVDSAFAGTPPKGCVATTHS